MEDMPVKVLLQEVRRSKGLSQNELARLIHMSPQNIQKIEQGDAKSLTFVTLGRLCKALACQPGDLLIYEDDPDDNDNLEVTAKPMALGEPRQHGESDTTKHRKRPRSFLTVIPEVPESA